MNGSFRRSNHRGFTLIELMIVIGIIAILAGILVPNFVRARSEANLTGCKENLRTLNAAVAMCRMSMLLNSDENSAMACDIGPTWEFDKLYAAGHPGGRPTGPMEMDPAVLVDAGFLKALPECPSAGRSTYQVSIKADTGTPYFIIYCAGDNHANLGIPTDYPRYIEGQGLFEK